MSRGSNKRRERRIERLRELAGNPWQFREKWLEVVGSWCELAQQRANALSGKNAEWFTYLPEDALDELLSCGQDAYDRLSEETNDTILHEVRRALADVINPHLYPGPKRPQPRRTDTSARDMKIAKPCETGEAIMQSNN